ETADSQVSRVEWFGEFTPVNVTNEEAEALFTGIYRDGLKASGRSAREQADEFVKTSRPSSIIQRAADVEEVANLAVYLASPLSSATTGAALRVDGGVVDTLTM
ncbi:SDR family oxidoreductase, partial [Escherichia coli]